MDLARAEELLRQLRKQLKQLPADPAPAEVHRLRVCTRRVEAVTAAIALCPQKRSIQLRKALKPLRKAAGNVRDMDVLTASALDLRSTAAGGSLDRLIAHLVRMRRKSVAALRDTLAEQRQAARRQLKKYVQEFPSAFGKKPVRNANGQENGCSEALRLIDDLAHGPPLNASNLHSFRLKVKELHYIFEVLAGFDPQLVSEVRDVKDRIGDWHDWQQLFDAARAVLDPQQDRELLGRIASMIELKLTRALAASSSLRRLLASPKSKAS